jgi:predicted RecA/RadA family phage recombinase
MINFVKPGDVLTFTAPIGGVVSGAPVLIGSLLVVPGASAAATEEFEGARVGVFTLAKTTGEAWTEGVKLYWVAGTSKISTTAGGDTLVGVAAAAADSAAETGDVLLDGVAR